MTCEDGLLVKLKNQTTVIREGGVDSVLVYLRPNVNEFILIKYDKTIEFLQVLILVSRLRQIK